MVALTDEAADDLRELIRLSLQLGLIGPEGYYTRLAALLAMCRPESAAAQFASAVLRSEEWPCDEEDWPGARRDSNFDEVRTQDDDEARIVWGSRIEEDDLIIVQLTPAASSGLSNWYFRIGDPDPIPAVPHGHDRQNKRLKLDPYQGFKYSQGRQVGREPGAKIVALWNDDPFRAFALNAIQYFVGKNPWFNWKGRNPLVLPKRRRP